MPPASPETSAVDCSVLVWHKRSHVLFSQEEEDSGPAYIYSDTFLDTVHIPQCILLRNRHIPFTGTHIRILLFRSMYTERSSCWYQTVRYRIDLLWRVCVFGDHADIREADTAEAFLIHFSDCFGLTLNLMGPILPAFCFQ